MMTYEEDLYGLNTEGHRTPSILEQIRTCTHPRQLEYMIQHVGRVIDYTPSNRWYRKFKAAVRAKEKELGVRVMYTEDEIPGGTAHGG